MGVTEQNTIPGRGRGPRHRSGEQPERLPESPRELWEMARQAHEWATSPERWWMPGRPVAVEVNVSRSVDLLMKEGLSREEAIAVILDTHVGDAKKIQQDIAAEVDDLIARQEAGDQTVSAKQVDLFMPFRGLNMHHINDLMPEIRYRPGRDHLASTERIGREIVTTHVAPLWRLKSGLYRRGDLLGSGGMARLFRLDPVREDGVTPDKHREPLALKIMTHARRGRDHGMLAMQEAAVHTALAGYDERDGHEPSDLRRAMKQLTDTSHTDLSALPKCEEPFKLTIVETETSPMVTATALPMELVEGENLAREFVGNPPEEEPKEQRERLLVLVDDMIRVYTTVSALHGLGFVHRDIKPENLMRELATGRIRLLDLGISKARSVSGRHELSQVFTGTVYDDLLEDMEYLYRLLPAWRASETWAKMRGKTLPKQENRPRISEEDQLQIWKTLQEFKDFHYDETLTHDQRVQLFYDALVPKAKQLVKRFEDQPEYEGIREGISHRTPKERRAQIMHEEHVVDSHTTRSQWETLRGTPVRMAPEVALGRELGTYVPEKEDLFAFASTFFEISRLGVLDFGANDSAVAIMHRRVKRRADGRGNVPSDVFFVDDVVALPPAQLPREKKAILAHYARVSHHEDSEGIRMLIRWFEDALAFDVEQRMDDATAMERLVQIRAQLDLEARTVQVEGVRTQVEELAG